MTRGGKCTFTVFVSTVGDVEYSIAIKYRISSIEERLHLPSHRYRANADACFPAAS